MAMSGKVAVVTGGNRGIGRGIVGQPIALGRAASLDRIAPGLQHRRHPRLAPLAVGHKQDGPAHRGSPRRLIRTCVP